MKAPKGLNGSGEHSNVSSLEEARRRAAEKAKQEKQAERNVRVGAMSIRDWIVGAAFVAMALGMLWHWLSPLVRTTGLTR